MDNENFNFIYHQIEKTDGMYGEDGFDAHFIKILREDLEGSKNKLKKSLAHKKS